MVGVDEVGLPFFEAFVFGLNLGDRVATPLAVGPPDVGLGHFAFLIHFACQAVGAVKMVCGEAVLSFADSSAIGVVLVLRQGLAVLGDLG